MNDAILQIFNSKGQKMTSGLELFLGNRAFLYGESIFTSFTSFNRAVPFWDEHCKRLIDGANFLSPNNESSISNLLQNIFEKLKGLDESIDCYYRLTLFKQDKKRGLSPHQEQELFLVAEKRPYLRQLSFRESLISLQSNRGRYNFAHKWGNYLPTILSLEEAKNLGADEIVFLNEQKIILEASTSNIFWKRGEIIFTSLHAEVWPGIWQKKLIEFLRKKEVMVQAGQFYVGELEKAEEIWLTNAVTGILPVRNYQDRNLATEFSVKLKSTFESKQELK